MGDICSSSGKGIGTSALDYHLPGAVVTKNVFAGAKESMYPPGAGTYRKAGTDGLDLGADIDAVGQAAAAALAGSPRTVRPLVREPSNRKR
jgi:hypothetical protein